MLIAQDCTAIDIYIGWNWFDGEMGEKRIDLFWHKFFVKLLWRCKTPQHTDRAYVHKCNEKPGVNICKELWFRRHSTEDLFHPY